MLFLINKMNNIVSLLLHLNQISATLHLCRCYWTSNTLFTQRQFYLLRRRIDFNTGPLFIALQFELLLWLRWKTVLYMHGQLQLVMSIGPPWTGSIHCPTPNGTAHLSTWPKRPSPKLTGWKQSGHRLFYAKKSRKTYKLKQGKLELKSKIFEITTFIVAEPQDEVMERNYFVFSHDLTTCQLCKIFWQEKWQSVCQWS